MSDSSCRILAGLLEARTGQQLTMSRRWRIETALSSLLRDAGDGLRFLFDSPVLRPNTLFSLVTQLAAPVSNGLTPVFLVRRFANGDPAFGAALFGVAEAVIASLLMAVLPGSLLQRSLLGQTDHHVTEALLAVIVAVYSLAVEGSLRA